MEQDDSWLCEGAGSSLMVVWKVTNTKGLQQKEVVYLEL